MSERDLAWSGALTVAVCESLEARGIPVEVIAVSGCFQNYAQNTRVLVQVPVKSASENLIVDQLAAIIASPRTVRLAIFAHLSTVEGADISCSGLWPQGGGLCRDDLRFLGYDDEAVLIPAVYSKNDAMKVLASLNGE